MRPLAHITGQQQVADDPAHGGMPPGIPGFESVRSQAAAENFPVALRILPRTIRNDLLAVYGFARLTDDIGDRYAGDRIAALDWLERDLGAVAATGHAAHPAVAALAGTIERHSLDIEPFRDLIEANRRDQHQQRYETFDDLLDYCRLSANPVGRLVLAVFGIDDPDLLSLSDDVCSGLQIAEHLQDVGEDIVAGRVYMPQHDLGRLGCTDDDLRQRAASPALCRVIALETQRARALVGSGGRLVGRLRSPARLAVAGFVAGGLAALDSVERAGFDVLSRQCRPSRRRVARHAVVLLAGRTTT